MNLYDKSSWPEGPWKTEPDLLRWEDGAYDCVIYRNQNHGCLNGYAGVAKGHPLYKINLVKKPHIIQVYGNITFSQPISDELFQGWRGKSDYWYHGFDCYHKNDISPTNFKVTDLYDADPGFAFCDMLMSMLGYLVEERDKDMPDTTGTYKDIKFVKAQFESMLRQLKELES